MSPRAAGRSRRTRLRPALPQLLQQPTGNRSPPFPPPATAQTRARRPHWLLPRRRKQCCSTPSAERARETGASASSKMAARHGRSTGRGGEGRTPPLTSPSVRGGAPCVAAFDWDRALACELRRAREANQKRGRSQSRSRGPGGEEQRVAGAVGPGAGARAAGGLGRAAPRRQGLASRAQRGISRRCPGLELLGGPAWSPCPPQPWAAPACGAKRRTGSKWR